LHAALAQMQRDGCTVLFTTHHLDEAEALCDRVAIIDRGRLVATGSPRELVAQSQAHPTVMLRTAPPLAPELVAALPGAHELRGAAGDLHFQTSDPPVTLAALTQLLGESGWSCLRCTCAGRRSRRFSSA